MYVHCGLWCDCSWFVCVLVLVAMLFLVLPVTVCAVQLLLMRLLWKNCLAVVLLVL